MFGYVNLELKDICTAKYGKGNKIPDNNGMYPVYGCYGIVGYTDSYNNDNSPIVGHIGSAGKVVWGEGKHFVTYNGTICKPKDLCLSKYLYHLLLNLKLETYVKGNQPFLSVSDFVNIVVPVPEIQRQRQIIKTLDRFDKLCNNISEGLPAEIEARQKQYEYYRDKLLSFERK